jgi:hypothetical protein
MKQPTINKNMTIKQTHTKKKLCIYFLDMENNILYQNNEL